MTMDIQQYFQRFLANYTPYKKYWNYEDGCVLKGCIDLYHACLLYTSPSPRD